MQGHRLEKACDSTRHVSEEAVPWERTTGRALGDFSALRRYGSRCSPGLSPCNTGNGGGGRRSVSEIEGRRDTAALSTVLRNLLLAVAAPFPRAARG